MKKIGDFLCRNVEKCENLVESTIGQHSPTPPLLIFHRIRSVLCNSHSWFKSYGWKVSTVFRLNIKFTAYLILCNFFAIFISVESIL